jgi:hypothetical protein
MSDDREKTVDLLKRIMLKFKRKVKDYCDSYEWVILDPEKRDKLEERMYDLTLKSLNEYTEKTRQLGINFKVAKEYHNRLFHGLECISRNCKWAKVIVEVLKGVMGILAIIAIVGAVVAGLWLLVTNPVGRDVLLELIKLAFLPFGSPVKG